MIQTNETSVMSLSEIKYKFHLLLLRIIMQVKPLYISYFAYITGIISISKDITRIVNLQKNSIPFKIDLFSNKELRVCWSTTSSVACGYSTARNSRTDWSSSSSSPLSAWWGWLSTTPSSGSLPTASAPTTCSPKS